MWRIFDYMLDKGESKNKKKVMDNCYLLQLGTSYKGNANIPHWVDPLI